MKILTPKFRIVLGLVGVVSSFIMLASYLGIVPDRAGAIRQGRTSLAEAVAVYSSVLVDSANTKRLENDFALLTERNEDLLSIGLRQENGQLLVATGEHEGFWQTMSGEYSTESQLRVPIWSGDERWGQLELRFTEVTEPGIQGIIANPMVQLVFFLGTGCFVIFYFYLGKVLRQLDPSRAIPGRVRDALDTMAEGLLILDRKEHIVLANLAFSSMIGKSPDDLLGLRAGELPWMDTEGKAVEKERRPWNQALQTSATVKDRALRLHLPGENWRTFKVSCSPVLGDKGKYAGVLVSFDDITLLEEKEIELRKSKDMAEEANKAKSAFLANMSHEIRTPMNAILGFTELLMRGVVKNEQDTSRYLSTIHTSGKNLIELINDILDLSKVEAGRLEVERLRVKPYTIIQEVLQMMSVKAQEKGLVLDFVARTPMPEEIETDPARLRQIVFNLVGNAIKFTETGGVTVSCRYEKGSAGSLFFLDIIDTGIGMTEKAAKSIFNPFVQADTSVTRRFGGTGLGLSISHKFAQALGGDITVQSEEGKGSVFTVSLATGDLSGVNFLDPHQVVQYQQADGGRQTTRWEFPPAHVLVVDDGAENRQLVKLLLEDVGVTVDEAENGQVGVDKAMAVKYAVVLMDVQMPVMDGFTATRTLREQGVNTPIIALTANAMKGFEQECLAVGYTGFQTKPIDIDRFMGMMAGLLGGKASHDQSPVRKPLPVPAAEPQAGPSSVDQVPILSKLPASNEKFRRLIGQFVVRLGEQVAAMEQAAGREDFAELAALAHWLKGAGGTVGFDLFTEPAGRLEKLAKEGRGAEARQAVEKIAAMTARVVAPGADEPVKEHAEGAAPREDVSKHGSAEARDLDVRPQRPVISRLASMARLQPIIMKFVVKLEVQAARMETAWQERNLQQIADLAMWLKGEGGTVGYDDFTEPAAKLAAAARAGQQEETRRLLADVLGMARAVVPPAVVSES